MTRRYPAALAAAGAAVLAVAAHVAGSDVAVLSAAASAGASPESARPEPAAAAQEAPGRPPRLSRTPPPAAWTVDAALSWCAGVGHRLGPVASCDPPPGVRRPDCAVPFAPEARRAAAETGGEQPAGVVSHSAIRARARAACGA